MFSILAGGCNTTHPKSFKMLRPNGINRYVLLIIKTCSEFTLDGSIHHTTPGTGIIIDKNTPYSYYNPKGQYIDDWLHFLAEDDEAFCSMGIGLNEFFPVFNANRITLYIQQILFENTYASKRFCPQNADCLMKVLLNNILDIYEQKDDFSKYNIYYEKLKELRLLIQNDPKQIYTIQSIAGTMGISVSYFQHLYSNLFGISFQKDYIKMKIEYAANALLATDLTIEQIAQMCGYSGTVHFYRQFKSIIGTTPNAFRKQNR